MQYKYHLQEIRHCEAKECLRTEFHSLVRLLPHDADELVLRTDRHYVYVSA